MMRGPVACVLAVTYRCDARCRICDIWKRYVDSDDELAPEDYAWLPRTLRSVNLSGGEPFVRSDLPEIVDVVRQACPKARIVISTNGLATERIEEAVAAMRDVAVRISVDASGPVHDEMRGIEGAFERTIDTARRLKALGVSDLGLAATSSGANPGGLREVKALADELGLDFIASAVHSSPIFFGSHCGEKPRSHDSVAEVADIMREELGSRRPRDWAKAYYMRGLADYIEGRPRRLPCRAGADFFFMDPWGTVYPCNILGVKMGTIRDGSFEELQRRSRRGVGPAVAGCREQCWMVCTVSPPMRRSPLRPLAWIAGAKLLGLDTDVGR